MFRFARFSDNFKKFTRFFEDNYKRGRVGIRFQLFLKKNIA